MDKESLREHISELEQCQKYRVEKTLRTGEIETTELVYGIAANASKSGPFIRKRFKDPDLWNLYQRIQKAQTNGLRDPSLPRIYETGEDSFGYYSIIEFIKGDDLRSSDDADPVESFRCVCKAVQLLHERLDPPIIHRDIKPDNVVVVPDGVVLIDFGAARTFDADKDCDTRLYATRAYAPPEQFGYAQTDCRSDIYSLGMLLVFLETGRDPDPDTRHAINEGASRLIDMGISPASARTIVRACAFDPDVRFASVKAMMDYLEAEMSEKSECDRFGDTAQIHARSGNFLPPDSADVVSIDPSVGGLRRGAASGGTATAAKPSGGILQRFSAFKKKWDEGAYLNAGIGWDVAIAIVWLFFLTVCIYLGIGETNDAIKGGIALRLVAYIGVVMPIFTAAGALLLDWRPIRSIDPLSKIKRWHVMVASLAVFLTCMIVSKAFGAL